MNESIDKVDKEIGALLKGLPPKEIKGNGAPYPVEPALPPSPAIDAGLQKMQQVTDDMVKTVRLAHEQAAKRSIEAAEASVRQAERDLQEVRRDAEQLRAKGEAAARRLEQAMARSTQICMNSDSTRALIEDSLSQDQ